MSRAFRRIAVSILLAAALFAQPPDAPTFGATTKLVQVSFNVARGKYFAADLQASDFVLLEDGHPREFTVFEGPNTAHPLPLELDLVFDTSKLPLKNPNGMNLPIIWDAKADYEFLDNWDESITRTVLEKNGMDVRLSVYHFDDGHFERLCGATRDPREIADAFRKLLDPIPAGNVLTLLPGDHVVPQGSLFWLSAGWWQEAAVATLKDAAASPVAARRVMFLFSDLWGGTRGASWQTIGDEANALGIAIDPVILDIYRMAEMRHGIFRNSDPDAGPPGSSIPVEMPDGSNWYVAVPFVGQLGDMTGGEEFIPEHLSRDELANILQDVRDTTLSKYVVGFAPEATAKPRKHKLKVELKSKSAGKMVGGEREGVVY